MKEGTGNAFLMLSFHYNWDEEILDSVQMFHYNFLLKKDTLAIAFLCEPVYEATMSFVMPF